ncbi:MAG: hypothetical protein R2839_02535 [Thermomicrobiales bacterium]
MVIAVNQSGLNIGRSLAEVAEAFADDWRSGRQMLIDEHPYALMIFHRRLSEEENRERVQEDNQPPGHDGGQRRSLSRYVRAPTVVWMFCAGYPAGGCVT